MSFFSATPSVSDSTRGFGHVGVISLLNTNYIVLNTINGVNQPNAILFSKTSTKLLAILINDLRISKCLTDNEIFGYHSDTILFSVNTQMRY